MGCGPSAYEAVLSKEEIAELRAVGMRHKQLTRIHGVFKRLDVKRTNRVGLSVFLAYYDIERTPFTERVFFMVGGDSRPPGGGTTYGAHPPGGGTPTVRRPTAIEFNAFVWAMWAYCSFDYHMLAKFAFDMYDSDNSGCLDRAEVKEIIGAVYGKASRDSRVQRVFARLDADGDGEVSLEEFVSFSRRFPVALFPAFMLQRQLRTKTGGEKFWRVATENRRRVLDAAGGAKDADPLYRKLASMATSSAARAMEQRLGSQRRGLLAGDTDTDADAKWDREFGLSSGSPGSSPVVKSRRFKSRRRVMVA